MFLLQLCLGFFPNFPALCLPLAADAAQLHETPAKVVLSLHFSALISPSFATVGRINHTMIDTLRCC
jgi:hypothetical protein